MQMLMIVMYVLVIIFIMVLTVMTAAKILSAEQNDLGIYKSIGFKSGSLRLTFAIRFGITAFVGSFIGIVLSAIFTDPLVSSVMKFAGISNFSSAPTFGNILLPLGIVTVLFTCFAYLAAVIAAGAVGDEKEQKYPIRLLDDKREIRCQFG